MTGTLFLWGLLALLQITFLPGHILLRALRLRPGIVDSLLLTFGLSTLFNYLFLTLLARLHWYTWKAMIATIIVETIIVLLLWTRDNSRQLWASTAEAYQDAFALWPQLRSPERGLVVGIAVLALYSIFALAHGATAAWQDSAFTVWDAVVSWNRWAIDWASNHVPRETYRYPQLLPSNSSIVYVLSGTKAVQAFNRLFFAIFPVALLLCLFDFGLRGRRIGFWIGIPLLYFAWTFMPGPSPTDGYADVPGTFMILMAIYCAVLANEQPTCGLATRWILAAGLFAGASLVTKQVGLYVVVPFPLLLALTVNTPALSPRQKRNAIISAFTIALAVSVPWYVVKEVQIRLGLDTSELNGINAALGGRDFFGRIHYGIQTMFATWGAVQTIGVTLLAIASLLIPGSWRWVTACVVLPGAFVWSITTSYDLRNANFFIALGCVSAGQTVAWLLGRTAAAWRDWPVLARRATAVASCIVVVFALSFMPTVANKGLAERSLASQRTGVMPGLNAVLYRLIAEKQITHPIITNYAPMSSLPGLKKFMVFNDMKDLVSFSNAMTKVHPEYLAILRFAINPLAVSDAVIAQNQLSGKWSIAATGPGFMVIQVHQTPIPLSERALRFGAFNVLDGLSAEEGPYPQWGLPTLRWGLGPATTLEFDAPNDEPYVLNLGVARTLCDLSINVSLNGSPVASAALPVFSSGQSVPPKQLTFDIRPHPGKNRLEIRYSAWDTQSDARHLAVLYSSLRILPK